MQTYAEAVYDPTTLIGRAANRSAAAARERFAQASEAAETNGTSVEEELVQMWRSAELCAA